MSEPIDPTVKLVILTEDEAQKFKLNAIRAFLARVERRVNQHQLDADYSLELAIQDELAAMEKGSSE